MPTADSAYLAHHAVRYSREHHTRLALGQYLGCRTVAVGRRDVSSDLVRERNSDTTQTICATNKPLKKGSALSPSRCASGINEL